MFRVLTIASMLILALNISAVSSTIRTDNKGQRLISSPRQSAQSLIYKINAQQVRKFKKGTAVKDLGLSKDYIAKYTPENGIPHLDAGNYLICRVEGSQIEYKLHTVDNLQWYCYYDDCPRLVLTDNNGNTIKDARVKVGSHSSTFDQDTESYPLSNRHDNLSVEIDNQGTLHYVEISRYNTYRPGFWQRLADRFKRKDKEAEPIFRQFLVFSKPEYRPGDRVKFKAFLVDKKGYPLTDTIDVRIRQILAKDTLIARISPTTSGTYCYDFIADKSSTFGSEIILSKGTEEITTESFLIRDYELKSSKFYARTDEYEYTGHKDVKVFLKMCDENGMSVTGGNVSLTLKMNRIDTIYDDSAFIPDIIWQKNIDIKEAGENLVVIPDSIFIPEVTGKYSLKCNFKTANKEINFQTINFEKKYRNDKLQYSFKNGRLHIELNKNGKPQKQDALITRYNISGEKLRQDSLMLPVDLEVFPYQAIISVNAGGESERIYLNEHEFALEPEISLDRNNDSLRLIVSNPYHLNCRYTLYKNKKPIYFGTEENCDRLFEYDIDADYSLMIASAVTSGSMEYSFKNCPSNKDQITITPTYPAAVYPGMTTNMQLLLTDYKGQPLPDADVTAWAYTSKFQDKWDGWKYTYSKRYYIPRQNIDSKRLDISSKEKLNWEAQAPLFGVDSLEYYHFLYTDSIYKAYLPTSDSMAVLSPYIIMNGDVYAASVLKIDGRIYSYSNLFDEKDYNFCLTPNTHSIEIRLPDRIISIPQLKLNPYQKLILAINADGSCSQMNISKAPKKLSKEEQEAIARRIFRIEKSWRNDLVRNIQTATSDDYMTCSNKTGRLREIAVAPYFTDVNIFMDTTFINSFQTDGGYSYNVGYNQISAAPFEYPVESEIRKQSIVADFSLPYTYSRVLKRMQIRRNEHLRDARFWNLKETTEGNPTLPHNIRLVLDNAENNKDILLYYFQTRRDTCTYTKVFNGSTSRFQIWNNCDMVVFFSDSTFIRRHLQLEQDGKNIRRLDMSARKVFDELHSKLFADLCAKLVKEKSFNPRSELSLKNLFKRRVEVFTNTKEQIRMNSGTCLTEEAGLYCEMSDPLFRDLMKSDITQKIILNGLPYNGYYESIDEESIISVKKISGEDARNLYGENCEVLVIVTKNPDAATGSVALRKNFSDEGFWMPTLRSDKDGKVNFKVTFPDDITMWETYVAAIGNRQSGSLSVPIKSYKAVAARLSTPRFAICGDSINAIGEVRNYLNDTTEVTTEQLLDSISMRRVEHSLALSLTDTVKFVAKNDSTTITYIMRKQDGYSDGEQQTIPVYKKGSNQTCGMFKVLDSDSTAHYKALNNWGEINLRIDGSIRNIAEQEISYLENYKYLCNEQMASKIRALIAQKSINRGLSKEQTKAVKDYIDQLQRNQNGENLWGWWNQGSTELWISEYVYKTMLMADKAGFRTSPNKTAIKNSLLKMLDQLMPEKKTRKADILIILDMLTEFNTDVNFADYRLMLAEIKNQNRYQDMYETMLWDRTGAASADITEMMKDSKTTALSSIYWESGEKRSFFHPVNNDMQTTLLAYRILKNHPQESARLEKVRNYFFEKRGISGWANTYISASLLSEVLMDMADKTGEITSKVTVNGKLISELPYNAVISDNEVNVVKSGNAPLFFTAYQQRWNEMPEKENKRFAVKTYMSSKAPERPMPLARNSKVEYQKTDSIEVREMTAGQTAYLTAEVNVEHQADYVMIEIPIPAGCSYASENTYWWNGESHREYLRNKVCIFCNNLQPDIKRFTVHLLPRFTGRYTLNPAKAEMMYFPTVSGREEVKEVRIK